jgi:hypothetical protein
VISNTVKTTLPVSSPAIMAANPSLAPASGRVRSTSGRTPDCSQNLSSRASWSRVPIVEPTMDSWVKKTRFRSAGGTAPLVAPLITTRPPGRSERSECAQVASPTVSMTPSTRSGSRAPVSNARSAPSLTARSRLASLRLVTHTR